MNIVHKYENIYKIIRMILENLFKIQINYKK